MQAFFDSGQHIVDLDHRLHWCNVHFEDVAKHHVPKGTAPGNITGAEGGVGNIALFFGVGQVDGQHAGQIFRGRTDFVATLATFGDDLQRAGGQRRVIGKTSFLHGDEVFEHRAYVFVRRLGAVGIDPASPDTWNLGNHADMDLLVCALGNPGFFHGNGNAGFIIDLYWKTTAGTIQPKSMVVPA